MKRKFNSAKRAKKGTVLLVWCKVEGVLKLLVFVEFSVNYQIKIGHNNLISKLKNSKQLMQIENLLSRNIFKPQPQINNSSQRTKKSEQLKRKTPIQHKKNLHAVDCL